MKEKHKCLTLAVLYVVVLIGLVYMSRVNNIHTETEFTKISIIGVSNE